MSTEKLTILVADSRLILKTFSRILGADYEVVEVSDGEEAWEKLQEEPDICALFCDTKLPHISGLELLQRLRVDVQPRLKNLPVIMLTGDSDDEALREQALGYGASDFITKPFDSVELKARAKAHVSERLASGEVEENIGTIDPVTQLGNKPFFMTRGGQMASFANRHHSAISLLLIKIDGFDGIVQKYADSPKVLENLLITVGSFIASGMRKEDTVARVDQSLFGMLLASTDMTGAIVAAQRVQDQVAQQEFPDDIQLQVSIGIACPTANAERQFKLLVVEARKQLKAAQKLGGQIKPTLADVKPPEPEAIDSLDECLDIIKNAKDTTVDAEHLINQLFPLLAYCDKRLGLRLSENVLHLIKR